MTWRYPDSPSAEIHRDGLAKLPPAYMAQLKMDGWRCVIEFGDDSAAPLPPHRNHVTFTSRHGKPIPISLALELRFLEAATNAKIMPGTILDAEWLSRRPAAREEALWVFDVMQLGDEPLWHRNTVDRFDILQKIVPSEWIVPYSIVSGPIPYQVFFDFMKRNRPDAEGIVLKRLDAKYIGSVRECALNPGWLRCKWRAGEDGRTEIA